jgi:hypothetical protein
MYIASLLLASVYQIPDKVREKTNAFKSLSHVKLDAIVNLKN